MSVSIDVEHLFLGQPTKESLLLFKETLDRQGFTIKRIRAFDTYEYWKKGHRYKPTLDSFPDIPKNYFLLQVEASNNTFHFDFAFWLTLIDDSGLLLEDDPPEGDRWILSYSASWSVVERFDFEIFVREMHNSINPFKTVCFSPGFGYEGEDEAYEKVIEKYQGDHIYVPTIYFAIIKPSFYGNLDNIYAEIRRIKIEWHGPNVWKESKFPKETEKLKNGDLFVKYNDIL